MTFVKNDRVVLKDGRKATILGRQVNMLIVLTDDGHREAHHWMNVTLEEARGN